VVAPVGPRRGPGFRVPKEISGLQKTPYILLLSPSFFRTALRDACGLAGVAGPTTDEPTARRLWGELPKFREFAHRRLAVGSSVVGPATPASPQASRRAVR
jgi:hypothetical protein